VSTTASDLDAVARPYEVTQMKALHLLVAASAVALGLTTAVADAQGPPRGDGGGYRGAPPHGGSFRGGPAPGWGRHVAPAPRTNIVVGVGGPVWWGPGWRGGWWGPGVGWGSPVVWSGGWWGPGVWPGSWWGPGVWVPPATAPVIVAQAAPVFIERSPPEEPAAQVWWYWCADARAYYPYVKECPGGWQRVAPQAVRPADKP
jgi:hypothetical protein